MDVVATDADTDTLTYSMTSDTYINPENSIVTKCRLGHPMDDCILLPNQTMKRRAPLGTVTVSDGTNSVTQDITVTINNLNDNTPVFVSEQLYC